MTKLSNRSFELVENADGHAADSTIMTFCSESNPCRATYQGDNVRYGSALVETVDGETRMVYHALTSDGELVAGKAIVTFFEADDRSIEMHLRWQWLDRDGSGGISKWRELL